MRSPEDLLAAPEPPPGDPRGGPSDDRGGPTTLMTRPLGVEAGGWLRRLSPLWWAHRRVVAIALIASVISSATLAVTPWLQKIVIDSAILHHTYRLAPAAGADGWRLHAAIRLQRHPSLQCRPGQLGHRLRPAQHRLRALAGLGLRPPRPAADRPARLEDELGSGADPHAVDAAPADAGERAAVPAGRRDHGAPLAAADRHRRPADAAPVLPGVPDAPRRLPVELGDAGPHGRDGRSRRRLRERRPRREGLRAGSARAGAGHGLARRALRVADAQLAAALPADLHPADHPPARPGDGAGARWVAGLRGPSHGRHARRVLRLPHPAHVSGPPDGRRPRRGAAGTGGRRAGARAARLTARRDRESGRHRAPLPRRPGQLRRRLLRLSPVRAGPRRIRPAGARRARRWRWSGPRGRASPPSGCCCPASTTSRRVRCWSTGSTSAR